MQAMEVWDSTGTARWYVCTFSEEYEEAGDLSLVSRSLSRGKDVVGNWGNLRAAGTGSQENFQHVKVRENKLRGYDCWRVDSWEKESRSKDPAWYGCCKGVRHFDGLMRRVYSMMWTMVLKHLLFVGYRVHLCSAKMSENQCIYAESWRAYSFYAVF